MRPSRLGRGLSALIREVPSEQEECKGCDPPILLYTPLPWPVEHPDALTPTPLRLQAREALEKLSIRSEVGREVAPLYLDKLRQQEGRTHVSLDLPSGVDLTSSTMLQLTRGRITNSTRYQFFGVSIWK